MHENIQFITELVEFDILLKITYADYLTLLDMGLNIPLI